MEALGGRAVRVGLVFHATANPRCEVHRSAPSVSRQTRSHAVRAAREASQGVPVRRRERRGLREACCQARLSPAWSSEHRQAKTVWDRIGGYCSDSMSRTWSGMMTAPTVGGRSSSRLHASEASAGGARGSKTNLSPPHSTYVDVTTCCQSASGFQPGCSARHIHRPAAKSLSSTFLVTDCMICSPPSLIELRIAERMILG